jgi:hypothetical protein
MPSKLNDPVRDMIYTSIKHHLLPPGVAPPLKAQPEEVDSIEAKEITPNAVRISVKLNTGGTRHFWVKVSEEW